MLSEEGRKLQDAHDLAYLRAQHQDRCYQVVRLAEENVRLRESVQLLAREPADVVLAHQGGHGSMSRKAILRLLPHMVPRSHHTRVLEELERLRGVYEAAKIWRWREEGGETTLLCRAVDAAMVADGLEIPPRGLYAVCRLVAYHQGPCDGVRRNDCPGGL